MDELNPTIFASDCDSMELRKSNPPGVLKGVDNGGLQFMGMQNRDQEYIDHTLLGPEYINNTIPSHYIIDLIDQDPPGPATSDCPIPSLNGSEAFPSEAQLHTIFQFVNRQGQVRTQASISGESNGDQLLHQTDKEILESELLAMHGNLLNEQNFKLFCAQQSIPTQEALNQDLNVSVLQNLPEPSAPLTPMRWMKKERYEEPVEEISDLLGPLGGTAKKILPHKKRISKKLKIMDKPESLYQINDETPSRNERLVISNGTQFECEICGSISESQVQFFSHLKGHYEPNILDDGKCPTENIRSASIVVSGDTSVIAKTEQQQASVVGDQVFNGVELNFDNFNEVVGLPTQHQHVTDNPDDQTDIKMLDSSEMAKCMEYVVQAQETSQTCSVHDEVEFSDTEDMLEGIRGVVDKVSVDDTSDDLDMQPASVSKEPWFANSAFNGLGFKEESINNESFRRVSDLLPMQPIQSNGSDERKTPITCMPSSQVDDEFNDDHHHDDESSQDLNDIQAHDSSDFSKKRKRGRPKGSKKKNPTVEIRLEDDSSNEIKDTKKRRYLCPKCNREFNSCNALKYHDLSHTGERPHQCDVCGKSFFAQSALKSHLRVHTGDKPYECDKCHRKFRQWSDLKYHKVSIHSDEKNYQCEFCGKSFSRKYSLMIHRRIHTCERNYKCEYCAKTFRASSYLQNHRKIHTGEKPYGCSTCGKKFRVSGDLRRHYKTHERNKSTKGSSTSEMSSNKQSENLGDIKQDVLLKMGYQKGNNDHILFLDKMTTKIDNIFKTEDSFVNSSMDNTFAN